MDLELKEFLELYTNYQKRICIPNLQKIKSIFKTWREEDYWQRKGIATRRPNPFPIQRIRTRLKRPESVVDKILRLPDSFIHGLSEDSLHRMHDLIGIRIIVYFLSDLAIVDKEIRNSKDFEVSVDPVPKAYVFEGRLASNLNLDIFTLEAKQSGYVSLHYLLQLRPIHYNNDFEPIWFELQVRTLIEDAWAEIEHLLGYKPQKKTLAFVKDEFRILSNSLQAIDQHFDLLSKQLLEHQSTSSFKEDFPLNPENFPAVLSEVGLNCGQREIFGMIKLLYSRGIKTVHDLRSLLLAKNIKLIEDIYIEVLNKKPKIFEIISNIANLRDITDETKAVDIIKSQISYNTAWEQLSTEFKRELI